MIHIEVQKNRSLVLAVSPTLLRHSLQQVLGTYGFDIVASTGEGSEAITEILTRRPAVALVTLNLPPFGGLNVMASVAHTRSDLAMVALIDPTSPRDHEKAFRSGALSCIFVHDSIDHCCFVLERATSGDAVLGATQQTEAPMVSRRYRSTTPSQSTASSHRTLSRREEQVIRLVSHGRTVNQIASEMVISPKTVKHHLAATYAKLGVHNRTDAVLFALRQGIVQI